MNTYPPGLLINDRYEVASHPLMGGMGIVYLCMDHEEDRPVALKTFKPEYLPDREARDRFLREGVAWIELGSHPHIVRCYGVERSEDGNEVFLILEQVAKEQGRDDPSLRSWLQPGRPLPIDQALLFALQIARGMKHAVAKIPGFVHRDLKPENVLVGADYITGANVNRLRVTDFGLASVLNVNLAPKPNQQPKNANFMGRTQLTHGIVGTPLYMSPEQWKGEPVSIATDVYALGCILYEMLAGRTLVIGNTIDDLEFNHNNRKYGPLPSGLPEGLIRVVKGCLSSNPEKRYADWKKAVTALENAYQSITRKTAPAEETAKDLSRAEQVSIGLGYANLGAAYFDIGKTKTTLPYFERALSIAQIHGDQGLESVGLAGLGALHAYLGERNQAIECSEKALIISRSIGNKLGESVLLSQLGTVYKNTGNVQRALEYHENAIKIARQIGHRHGESSYLSALGIDYKHLGDAKRAMECYEQALIINDEIEDRGLKVNILINMGIAHKNLNATKDAIRCYEQALAIARDIGDRDGEGKCLSNLGNIYLIIGNAQKASGFFEQSIELSQEIGSRPMEGFGMMNLGRAYADLGDGERAIRLLDQSAVIFEEVGDLNNSAQVLYDKSRILAENGDINRAILLAKEAMRIWTQTSHPNAKSANELLTELNNIAKENKPSLWSKLIGKKNAQDDLNKLDPPDVAALFNKSYNLEKLGRYEEAIRYYDEVLEIDPRHVGALDSKGICLNNLGRNEEAIRYYDKVLEIDPRHVDALFNKGNSLNSLGRYEEAIHYYDKELEIDPRNVYALYNKGNSLDSLGRYEEAIHYYDEALKINPRHTNALGNKGSSLNSLGHYEEAIHYYDKALEIDPRHVDALFNKSNSLYSLGRKREATLSYRKFLALAPAQYAKQIEHARQRIRELEGK